MSKTAGSQLFPGRARGSLLLAVDFRPRRMIGFRRRQLECRVEREDRVKLIAAKRMAASQARRKRGIFVREKFFCLVRQTYL